MFAINHAAAALIFRKHLGKQISLIWILVAVQLVEFLWVIFNLLGVEHTTTESKVRYVGDIHLSYMPYSHSIISSLIIAAVAAIGFLVWKRSWKVAALMALAFLSHIVLDFFTHARDLPMGFTNRSFVGLGLYSYFPILGFSVELGFGLVCWWYFHGSRTLFWIILLFNFANITMFLPGVKGVESYLAGKPLIIALLILFQIVATLALVGWAALKSDD